MASLLKSFGKGLLYLLVLPLLIVVLAFYVVIGLVIFLYIGIKGIFLYFTGRNIFGDLPEDIKAREILEGNSSTSSEEEEAQNKEEEKPAETPNMYTTYLGPIDHPLDEVNKPEEEKNEEENKIAEGNNNE